MLFFGLFQSLIGRNVFVTIELKHGLRVTGALHAVDQFLNVKLTNVVISEPAKFPQLVSLKTCFIRGSVIRYIDLTGVSIDTEMLQDACRRSLATDKKYASGSKPVPTESTKKRPRA